MAHEPLDVETLDELLPLITIDGYAVLLDALAKSGNRATRRKLLDRLSETAVDVVPLIVARLDDERWYVQRNMLYLLERRQHVPPGFSAMPWMQHPDDRVRYQAIRLQLTIPEEREIAVAAALEDADERITRVGLMALQEDFQPAFTSRVAQLAMNPRLVEELRVHAVRALGKSRERQRPRCLAAARRRRQECARETKTGAAHADCRSGAAGTRRSVGVQPAGGKSAVARAQVVRRRHAPGGASGATVSEPGTFLNYFAQALAVMTLYPDGHPSRERAIDAAFQALEGLSEDGQPSFTFLENEVVYGRERLRDFREWDWGSRLVAAGIQRLEFERRVSRDEFDSFLQEILARLTLSAIDTSENRQMRPIGIRFGAVGLQGETERPVEPPSTTLDITLGEEVETLRWMQDQVQITGRHSAHRGGNGRSLARRGHARRPAHGASAASIEGIRPVHDHPLVERGSAGHGPCRKARLYRPRSA